MFSRASENSLDKQTIPELPNSSEGFSSEASELYKELENDREKVEAGVVLTYGVFKETTSTGRVLDIHTLWTPKDIGEPTELDNSVLKIIAVDSATGKIAGDRNTLFDGPYTNKQTKEYMISVGAIITRFRGIGVASSIDKIYAKILQRITDTIATKEIFTINGKPSDAFIRWEVSNLNEDKIDAIEKSMQEEEWGEKTKEEKADFELKLKNAQMEQERWQSLYGDDGKLGIENNTRDFVAQKTPMAILPSKLQMREYNLLLEKLEEAIKTKD